MCPHFPALWYFVPPPSAKLFPDLDNLVEGDIFILRVLNEVLTYEVDQISIVLPSQVESLQVTEGEDYCTLVTCTPYGVNSHRLLVRGHRIENIDERTIHVTTDAMQIDTLLVAPAIGVPLLVLLLAGILIYDHRKKKLNGIRKNIGGVKSAEKNENDL